MKTVAAKQRFIRALCDSVRTSAVIAAHKMPETWDGHEIRAYLADKFECERTALMSNRRSARFKDYTNEVCIRNL